MATKIDSEKKENYLNEVGFFTSNLRVFMVHKSQHRVDRFANDKAIFLGRRGYFIKNRKYV